MKKKSKLSQADITRLIHQSTMLFLDKIRLTLNVMVGKIKKKKPNFPIALEQRITETEGSKWNRNDWSSISTISNKDILLIGSDSTMYQLFMSPFKGTEKTSLWDGQILLTSVEPTEKKAAWFIGNQTQDVFTKSLPQLYLETKHILKFQSWWEFT